MRPRILTLAIGLALSLSAHSQTIIRRDPAIERMVKDVSADSLRSYINTLVSFGTRHTMSSTTDKKRGIGAAREWVVRKFQDFARNSGGRMTAYVDTTTLPPDGRRVDMATSLGNAMAVLKGTDPNDDRVYIISGHIDSRVTDVMNRTADAPGANDDGSGTAAVIECARVMSRTPFPATIIFVAVAGEEQSLLGSTFLANKAKAASWNIDAVLNNDIMGSNNSSETNIIDNTRLRVFSETFSVTDTGRVLQNIRNLGLENDGRSRQLARYVKETGERYVDNLEVVLVYRNDRFLRGGDHTPFVNKGYAAVRLTEMNENFLHQHQDLRKVKDTVYGDLAEFMDFEYLRKNTAVNLSTLANLALAPSMPQDVRVDVRNLTNSTLLSWKAPKTGRAAGYYLLVRETTSPVWQRKFFTTETTMRLPISKDHYFFAVQAVDADGHESQAVVPAVGR
ncbi:MAG: M20/M25/M40 family metallo-hydrolase [Chitinophagaceae bacterium]|nr:MAG: M20/M25/M40 family metallo-hydrolase [Chitinophagaceae bacterium]